ncbi:hypothetical protein PF001_g4567 [Phytophthora fragariae]|uniref:DDE Tnp4 domain-containing protein n=2 Tax=Phytophthora fragariae TaxID=53985 RepID=A0A6A4EHU3_9STRA|nr:hypothetical protein PF001_g4567 [Phytophthora fragariae]
MTIRERYYLTMEALISPLQAAWHTMYVSRSEGSFINTVSIPPSAFDELLQVFSRHYVLLRPRRISELFGIPPATLSRVLHKAEIALDKALQEIPDAQVRYPSKHQQRQWARRVQEKEPLLDGVWGFVDGKNYRVQSPANADLRNAHYNGWLHTVLVTGTLCYGMDGTLVRGRHNLPGSWNDGETTANCK